jgi:hypothetical protein
MVSVLASECGRSWVGASIRPNLITLASKRAFRVLLLELPLFVLDQQAYLDFYSASSLKQQSADRHVTLILHKDVGKEPHRWCNG